MFGQSKSAAFTLLLTCLLLSFIPTLWGDSQELPKKGPTIKHYNIILIGATGDLAQKYLWRGLFDLFSAHYVKDKTQFLIYGCARKAPDLGRKLMSDILLGTIKCYDIQCREMKKAFVESVQFHQLKTEEHYEKLDDKVSENTKGMYAMLDADWTYEVGRLVYLSIPPSHYGKISKLVHKHLRPRIARNTWMRVVLEKPFGQDLESAKALAEEVSKHFKEEEIYRIDHYLGKTVVKQILPFRYINRDQYEPLWNHHHIDRVEIVMKEKVDVKGRTSFYDEVGVIRDIMQNHLMEMMALVAMETPEDSGNIAEILKSKFNFYRQIQQPIESDILTGQYASYNGEWLAESKGVGNVSTTPTFGATLLKVNNPRWQGVPFLLMSGKKMDEKASYVRIVFKNTKMCPSPQDSTCTKQRQLVFYIGGSDPKLSPMVVVSNQLPKPKDRPNWKLEQLQLDVELFGENINATYQLIPAVDDDAYTNLMQAVFEGARHLFIDTDTLLASWHIWTAVLKITQGVMPRIYQGKDVEPEMINFQISEGNGLRFDVDEDVIRIDQPQSAPSRDPIFAQIPANYRGHKLITGTTKELISKLSMDILREAQEAVRSRGVFHLALSGGRSPQQLLKSLTSPELYSFPWQHTHIWLVDERCRDRSDPSSNFHLLEANLLSVISVPYLNVHPMLVDIGDEPCDPSDRADLLYEASIKRSVTANQIDFILLGLGTDGHTASLFPNQTSLHSRERLAVFSQGGPADVSHRRMTLTFDLINQGRHVGVFVTGQGKHNIIGTLSGNVTDVDRYPVTGVQPTEGDLCWYIDYDALLGKTYS